jgi:hypothetical protein
MLTQRYLVLAAVVLLSCADSGSDRPDLGNSDTGEEVEGEDSRIEPGTDPEPDLAGDGTIDGDTDAPVDYCAEDNGGCDLNAFCESTEDAARCECHAGYMGDGTTCEDVASELDGLRIELPCTEDAVLDSCATVATAEMEATMAGTSSTIYEVTIRVRGVTERKYYFDTESEHGYWRVGGLPNLITSTSIPSRSSCRARPTI